MVHQNRTSEKYLIYINIAFLSASALSKCFVIIGLNREMYYSIISIAILVVVLKTRRWLRLDVLMYYCTFGLYVLYGVFINVQYFDKIINVYATLLLFLPAFLIIKINGCRYDIFLNSLRYSAYISLAYIFIFEVRGADFARSYMTISYDILMWATVMLYFAIKDKELLDILIAAISGIFILLGGTRGAMLSYFTFMIIIVLLIGGRKRFWGTLIIGVGWNFFMRNLGILVNVMQKYGLNTRAIDKLITNEFFLSKSRNNLMYYSIDLMNQRKWGYGAFGTRKYISPYPHSLIYEVLLDFGVYIGMLLIVAFFLSSAAMLLKIIRTKGSLDNPYSVVFIIILMSGVIPLFFSGSFYYTFSVPMIVGMLIDWKDIKKLRIPKGYMRTYRV